ncbi:MAG: HU family DNA-binding protein [Clostridia bacterium]
MKKNELIAKMSEKSGLSKKDSEACLNAFIESIGEALKEGDKVSLVGFGSFEVRERAERKGVNPKTKETITIKASKSPAFKAGKGLKDMLV